MGLGHFKGFPPRKESSGNYNCLFGLELKIGLGKNFGLGKNLGLGKNKNSSGGRQRRRAPDGQERRLRLNALQKRPKSLRKVLKLEDRWEKINIPGSRVKIRCQSTRNHDPKLESRGGSGSTASEVFGVPLSPNALNL